MNISVFSTKPYDEIFLNKTNLGQHELHYHKCPLTPETIELVTDDPCVCVFVNDQLNREVLSKIYEKGVRLVALRCAGFNNVDLKAAKELGITVVRVPAYSPESVAEHTIGLLLALSRKIHKANNRVHDGNFSLQGLLGFEIHNKTVGIVGTGRIGKAFIRILQGFGAHILAYDVEPDEELLKQGFEYVDFTQLCKHSDIISLHCPLTPETHYMINEESIGLMKQGVVLLNTSRGAVIDTNAVIEGLKSGKIGHVGLDVYEQEENLFFEDLSDKVINDDVFERLLMFPNVLVTGHQAFFTEEAMRSIAATTINNISEFEKNGSCKNTIQH